MNTREKIDDLKRQIEELKKSKKNLKLVICKIHDYRTGVILSETTLPNLFQGITVEQIIKYGKDIKNVITSIYPTTPGNPNLIRFYTQEGKYNENMQQIVEYI